MRKLGPATVVGEPKCRIRLKSVTTLTSWCRIDLESFAPAAEVEPAFPPLAAATPVAAVSSNEMTAITANAMVRRIRFIPHLFELLALGDLFELWISVRLLGSHRSDRWTKLGLSPVDIRANVSQDRLDLLDFEDAAPRRHWALSIQYDFDEAPMILSAQAAQVEGHAAAGVPQLVAM